MFGGHKTQKRGNLHRLLESASSSGSKTKWNQVLHYLQGHTARNKDAPTPPFDSPIPPYSCPTVDLEDQILDEDELPLIVAVQSAPSYVVAALCHLGPEATGIADEHDRLPLHWVCTRDSEDAETNQVIQILVECNPDALLQRDDCGRTPLHWLLWHHAPTRQVRIVEFMCQNHPSKMLRELEQPVAGDLPRIPNPSKSKEIPPSAIIIPDGEHGALPLHYAVMQGASREVLKRMIAIYPASVARVDRKHRTPLAWYLGAGSLLEKSKHVSGEKLDENGTPWWEHKLSTSNIQLLATSKVARSVDWMGRTPLHWASHFYARGAAAGLTGSYISAKAFQILIDTNIEALTVIDANGRTPLHVLFASFFRPKEEAFQIKMAQGHLDTHVDLYNGGPEPFNPPTEIVELLARSPDEDTGEEDACHVEDEKGYMPIHLALRAGTAPHISKLLIHLNSTSLIHRSEDKIRTPLADAFSSPFSAPLQSCETFEMLMASYQTAHPGVLMDGRLALKMEDQKGTYPIHHAVLNNASVETIRMFVKKFPRGALLRDRSGDLPIHCMLSKEHLFEAPERSLIQGTSFVMQPGLRSKREIDHYKKMKQGQLEKMRILMEPLLEPDSLKIACQTHGMTPLHIAIGFDLLGYNDLHAMLDRCPEAASVRSKTEGHELYCLDLHEKLRENNAEKSDEWKVKKELLFAFHPQLKSYRRDKDVLASCVQLIRDEITGKGSYHLQEMKKRQQSAKSLIDLTDNLSSVMAPKANKPKSTKVSKSVVDITPSAGIFLKTLTMGSSLSFGKAGKAKKKPKAKKNPSLLTSIYDEDEIDKEYVLSPQGSDLDDEDDFLSPRAGDFSDAFTSAAQAVGSEGPSKSASADSEADAFDKQEGVSPSDNGTGSSFLSDVAHRLWCFFVLYRNPMKPDDNYCKQVETILDGLEFDLADRMLTMTLPEFARVYLDDGTQLEEEATLCDVANPFCKAFFHSIYHFLGRFEFSTTSDEILIHRSSDGDTIWVRATEHISSTAEYKKEELAPGIAEASIWETGQMVEEETPVIPEFVESTADICFKFTRNQAAFENETECRNALSETLNEGHILPTFGIYNALGDSNTDRRYQMDTHDKRFQTLVLADGKSIKLSDYSFALVFPYDKHDDLFDFVRHHGLTKAEEVTELVIDITKALCSIHEEGGSIGSFSAREIRKIATASGRKAWGFSNLSNGCLQSDSAPYMGRIAANGNPLFKTGLMPPEMFVKVTPAELRIYQNYWSGVERTFNISVDKSVIEPYTTEDGNNYVLRCHYVPEEDQDSKLPELPYDLIRQSTSSDMWCFGLVLYTLCSGGRALLPSNFRTGHLLDFERIIGWGDQNSVSTVYEHVKEPLAQDLILKLLSSDKERSALTMKDLVAHPFLNKATPGGERIVKKRQQEKAVFDRRKRTVANEKSEAGWLQSKTTQVVCWDFDVLKKMHISCSALVQSQLNAPRMPCSFILLPYLLSTKNKKARLAPKSKIDVERSEQMGVLLLSLFKGCQFATIARDVIVTNNGEHWTASKLIELMTLPDGSNFEECKDMLVMIGAENVEAFRTEPMTILYKLVGRYVQNMMECFQKSGKAFFYFVDEYTGTPIVADSSSPYPMELQTRKTDAMVSMMLPFMFSSMFSACVTHGGVSGLVRLIFEAAYPHVPASWAKAGEGISHGLEVDTFESQMSILQDTLAFLSSSRKMQLEDNLHVVREMCLKCDNRASFGGMQRIECSGSSFWTSKESAAAIEEICRTHTFKDAMETRKKLEKQVKFQAKKIKQLDQEIKLNSMEDCMGFDEEEKEQNPNILNRIQVPLR
ncbi:unnamed protein product [Cylindrotheca closterium]|uniref:Protein kinase domain-containing protein n=1 Tax=Cylindrotheca closterium TaxID=2856 RepID=A0AAD2FZX4_9STRA|nr:unnamed protein product [Cylindrotheca closterium]